MEANGPKPSELTKVSAAVGQLPIPGAKIASFAADTILGAIHVADKKAWEQRQSELDQREDEETQRLASDEYTAQLERMNQEKNQGMVFGASGGKLSPQYYMASRKLNIGGVAPMKPEPIQQNPLQEITRGTATKTQGVRNNQQGLMDYAIDSIPGIVTFAKDAVAQNKDRKAQEAQEQEKKQMEDAASTTNTPVKPADPGGRSGGLGGSGGGMGGTLGSGFGSGMGGTAGAGGPDMGDMSKIAKIAGMFVGAPMEKGGKITGKGDGSGKDDKIEIESDGGYVIPVETLADKNKMDEVKSVVGHSDNEIANLNKTSGGGNAKVSSEEYYLTAPESEAVAAHFAAKGSDIDDELAPNTQYPMTEAADGGLLGKIRQFLGKKTAEGFLQKDYENVVHDYRGDVPAGTVYDQTDQTSIPTFQDWYDTHSTHATPGGSNYTTLTKKGFDKAGLNLADVAGEYDKWMEENRKDAYNKFTQNNTDKGGNNTNAGSSTTGGSNDDIVKDFQDWNKDFQSLYNKLTIADIAKDAALTYYNNEQTRKFPEPNALTQGHYPIPSLAGQKNKLDQKMGLINTLTTRQKTSDLASNMNLYAAGTASKLAETRTAMADMFDKTEAAKVDKHKEEIAIKEKNLANDQRYDQLDAYLTNDFLKQKGQAIGQGLDNITENLKSNLDTQVKNKTAEITLRSALEQQRMFEAGGQYTALSTELGQFFPQQWLSQAGMNQFMEMDPAERDAIIQEARRQKAAAELNQGSPPPVVNNPPVNPQGDENDPGESNND